MHAYQRAVGSARSVEIRPGDVDSSHDIPDGERPIVQVDDLSMGVFRGQGQWHVLHNDCLHCSGPVSRDT